MDQQRFTAWNPGIESETPREYRPLETIYRPENTVSTMADIDELSSLTGLPPEELVAFRPERLALHEVIVRVTADIVVVEGEREEDLGHEFRRIVRCIMEEYVQPNMAQLQQAYTDLASTTHERITQLLATTLFRPTAPAAPTKSSLLGRLFSKPQPVTAAPESPQERLHQAIAKFRACGQTSNEPLEKAICKSLFQLLGAMAGKSNHLPLGQVALAQLASQYVCNHYGSRVIGERIAPWIETAIAERGYIRFRNTEKPILVSLKGASAAGKSHMRPQLREAMRKLGMAPDAYITISPDIWRRQLLDYESLGDAYKYAGRLTSREVIIIDGKLDRYIRNRANRDRAIPHMLVDRFRFDSFASEKVGRILHNTYVKYVHTLYMYFIVTPPEATVERGWERGLSRGRYKSVDDFLDHAVEAYTGMPKILFKWLAYKRPLYHYEFLDNSVPKESYPKTIAVGDQQHMDVINPLGLVDIERYQKIDIRARSPEAVYPPAEELAVERNLGFLRQCLTRIPCVNFIDEDSGVYYARVCDGRFEVICNNTFARILENSELARVFAGIDPDLSPRT